VNCAQIRIGTLDILLPYGEDAHPLRLLVDGIIRFEATPKLRHYPDMLRTLADELEFQLKAAAHENNE
jgi:hypothetical protein